MTMLPEAPGFLAFEHTPATPLAYLRYTGDPSQFGWYLIERLSRCLIDVSGPHASEVEAQEEARTRAAARAAAQAARAARRRARTSDGRTIDP
jgi:hypothetical protein